jgi:putative ABC transport system substrate-binding protein
MDRRNCLTAALAVLAGPLFAQTRAGRVARIGILAAYAPNSRESSHLWGGFFDGMRDLGYVEGRDFVIEGRYFGDSPERLPALAAELVALAVDVIVVGSPPVPEAVKRATSTIPIVMTNHSDPLASGLVGNLSRPGGNVTGISLSGSAWRGKHVQLLHEAPAARIVAVLANPAIATHAYELEELRAAARALDLRILVVEAQPTKFDLVVNLATARRLGLSIPQGVLARADRVVE